jgi:hypothetical protein
MRKTIAAAALLAACTTVRPAPSPPAARVPDVTPAAQPSPSPSAAPSALIVDTARACVLRNGRLEEVKLSSVPASGVGDSLYQGRAFHRAFPTDSTYAAAAPWFAAGYIVVDGRRYHASGLPRVVGSTDVVPFVPIGPVMLFREPGSRGFRPNVVYAPVEPGCVFQPYMPVDVK